MASLKKVDLKAIKAFTADSYEFIFTIGSNKQQQTTIIDYDLATATQSLLAVFESYLKATYGRHLRIDWTAYEYCPAFD